MDCPRCMDALVSKFAGDVEIDICTGCGGWWLDRGELGKLVARGHRMGRNPSTTSGGDSPPGMPDAIYGTDYRTDRNHPANVGFTEPKRPSYAPTKMRCPRDNAVLGEAGVGGELVVTLDKCPQCGGYWLDTGELDRTVDFVRSRLGDRLPEHLEAKLDRRSLFEQMSDARGGASSRPTSFVGNGLRGGLGGGGFDAGDIFETIGQFALLSLVFNVIGELFD